MLRGRLRFPALTLILSLAACAPWQAGGPPDGAGDSARRTALMDFYRQWRGTPYRYGGAGAAGFDCSGFVHAAFRDVFGLTLPRTTEELAAIGQRVSYSELHAGDLVFFKTGWRKLHVGIYLGNDRFLHASESEGVTITPFAAPYWKKRFWQARRVM